MSFDNSRLINFGMNLGIVGLVLVGVSVLYAVITHTFDAILLDVFGGCLSIIGLVLAVVAKMLRPPRK